MIPFSRVFMGCPPPKPFLRWRKTKEQSQTLEYLLLSPLVSTCFSNNISNSVKPSSA